MSVDARKRSRATATARVGTGHRSARTVGAAVLVAGLGAVLLAGCKSSGPQAAGSSSPSGSAPATGSASPSPSRSESAAPSPTPSTGAPRPSEAPPSTSAGTPPAGTLHTYSGTITRGVEPGCTILQASGGTYELVGADAAAKKVLRPHASVQVRGYIEHGMMSHCMQGKMLKVVSAKAR